MLTKQDLKIINNLILKQANKIVRIEFEELKELVGELVQAQKRTDNSIEKLAIAQKKTEERLDRVEVAVEERLDRVEAAVEKLAIAQKKTEERLDRVEAAIEKLTIAQRKTEEAVAELAVVHKRFEENFNFKITGLGARWGMNT